MYVNARDGASGYINGWDIANYISLQANDLCNNNYSTVVLSNKGCFEGDKGIRYDRRQIRCDVGRLEGNQSS